MKIGLVLDTSLDPPDGVQQYVIGIGEWLRTQGHDVHYLVGETTRTDLPNIHSLARNFKVRFNGNRTTIPLPASRRRLRHFLRRHQFDVLHVQTPHNPFLAQKLILAASPTTAVITTFHVLPEGRLPIVATYMLGLWLRPSLKRVDRMLSVSAAAARFEESTFRVKSAVLPNVFDYRLFREAQAFDRYNDDVPTILFLGRLVPRKGCRYLLEAIAQLDRTVVPQFRVVICGKGPLLPELQAYAKAQGLEDVVEFAGFVTEADKPRYYASADIAVFPSTGGESFGIVLIEAMAAARGPVLGGDNPGYASVLEPFPTQLFKPQDTNELAAQLAHYLDNSAVRHTVAERQKDYVQQYDVTRVGQELVTIYKEALQERRNS